MWVKSDKMVTVPSPAANHALISSSQSRSCIFRKCTLNPIRNFGGKMSCSLLPVGLFLRKRTALWICSGMFVCLFFNCFWNSVSKFIQFDSRAVTVDLE